MGKSAVERFTQPALQRDLRQRVPEVRAARVNEVAVDIIDHCLVALHDSLLLTLAFWPIFVRKQVRKLMDASPDRVLIKSGQNGEIHFRFTFWSFVTLAFLSKSQNHRIDAVPRTLSRSDCSDVNC